MVETTFPPPAGGEPGQRRRRWARVGLLVTLLFAAVLGGEAWAGGQAQQPDLDHQYSSPTLPLAANVWAWPTTPGAPLALREPGYRLGLNRGSGVLSVSAPGVSYSFPLVALVGRTQLPTGAHFVATTAGAELDLYIFNRSGRVLERAKVLPRADFFTITFSAEMGPDRFAGATFLSDGRTGLPRSFLTHAFSPDPFSPSLQPTPTTFLGVHHPFHTAPFAPPPFDLEFRSGAGWAGIGLVQVPDATALTLTKDGAISVNYPLSTLASIKDEGNGGRVSPPATVPQGSATGTWLGFPSLVLTFGRTASANLLSYHGALSQMGEAPVASNAGQRPSWWAWPMVDTWGQQLVSHAARTSPAYTARWVANFVNTWKRRFGIEHFTVIIDAQWQARLGYATPSSRFGGVAGMRELIQQLHSQGLKVMLWWPLWKQVSSTGKRSLVDPTATSFRSQIARQMSELLGTGPGDLGANGLKLDWGFLVPPPTAEHLSRPQLGVGAALLLRYMRLLSQSAWRANPAALIDASAVAPQFGGTEDTLRLYDAAQASTWSYRAAIVSAVDPTSLIDGDGWRLDRSQAVAHIVQSAVFGIPAMYYATRWAGGTSISPALARSLGSVLALGQARGDRGRAQLLASGQWTYEVGNRLVAATLDNSRALAVFTYGPQGNLSRATVVSALTSSLQISPIGDAVPTSVEINRGARVHFLRSPDALRFTAQAGQRYVIHFTPARERAKDVREPDRQRADQESPPGERPAAAPGSGTRGTSRHGGGHR
ncbi:MAG: hypothetical protein M0027_09365 [Candidatus Dormibacteraeota bacterium]|nr:hypothetical protein [Candidatus Dormibacteraeota bacterium]